MYTTSPEQCFYIMVYRVKLESRFVEIVTLKNNKVNIFLEILNI